MRATGTVSRGIRTPIIKQGDDLASIVAESVVNAAKSEGFALHERDVVGITESIAARAGGNYATLEQIAADVRIKMTDGKIGLVFPILSRNRFSQILKGISMGSDEITIMLGYPSDEVGNPLISLDLLDEKGVNPYTDTFTEEEFTAKFGKTVHPFTGVDYISYYKELTGGKGKIILGNNPVEILKYTKNVIAADIHSRFRTKKKLFAAGAEKVLGLDEILTESVNGSGFHPDYGLLGSNLATDNSVKLFPRDTDKLVLDIQNKLKQLTGKNIEVMVYGDGAFKDPVGGIWELADPVVSPSFTKGLEGTPNELKLKYLADNAIGSKQGDDAADAIREMIKHKEDNMVNNMSSQGTTPRRLTDLLGSLCDLTSGSGDKGTPVILVQGYFDTFADM